METTDGGLDWADRAARDLWPELYAVSESKRDLAHDIKAIAKAIRDHTGRPPDYYADMNPHLNLDEYILQDVHSIAGCLRPGEISRYATYFLGPIKYAACVLREGNDGQNDTEIRWFDAEKDAQEAVDAKPVEAK